MKQFAICSTVLVVCLLVSSVQSDKRVCGCREKVQKRIANGVKVSDGKYPWLASIHSMALTDHQNLTGIFL